MVWVCLLIIPVFLSFISGYISPVYQVAKSSSFVSYINKLDMALAAGEIDVEQYNEYRDKAMYHYYGV